MKKNETPPSFPMTLERYEEGVEAIRNQKYKKPEVQVTVEQFELFRKILKIEPGFFPSAAFEINFKAKELGIE